MSDTSKFLHIKGNCSGKARIEKLILAFVNEEVRKLFGRF